MIHRRCLRLKHASLLHYDLVTIVKSFIVQALDAKRTEKEREKKFVAWFLFGFLKLSNSLLYV
jgi:hypothetical protein